MKEKRKPYIDNKQFYSALLERREKIHEFILKNSSEQDYESNKQLIDAYVNQEDVPQYNKKLLKEFKKLPGFPRITDYIGDCFTKIANNFITIQSSNHSYSRYPFKDEMIGDAIINCIKYVDTFNPYKGKNPFSFFTSCVYHSFCNKIHEERKELGTKQRLIKKIDFAKIATQEHDDSEIVNEYIDHLQSFMSGKDYSEYYLTETPEKKVRIKNFDNIPNLNLFFEEQDV